MPGVSSILGRGPHCRFNELFVHCPHCFPHPCDLPAAILIATGPDEYYFVGGGMRIDFAPNARGPQNVGLGDVQQGNFVNGEWVVARQIAGDDDAQGEILMLRPYTILRVTLYRFP